MVAVGIHFLLHLSYGQRVGVPREKGFGAIPRRFMERFIEHLLCRVAPCGGSAGELAGGLEWMEFGREGYPLSFTANIEELISQNQNGLLVAHSTWTRVPLGQIADVVNGFPFASSGFNSERGTPIIRIRDVTSGSTSTLFEGEVPNGYWVDIGDIVIGMDGDFGVRRWNSVRALLNQRVCKVTPNESFYNRNLIYWVLPGYLGAINEATPSITVKHLSSRTLEATPIPLPPLAEQKVIADKLEALLDQVDTLKARLNAIPEILKRFRQSVLSAAVTGKLTEEWRKKVSENNEIQVVEIGEDRVQCPKEWTRLTLRDIIQEDRPLCYGVVQPGENDPEGVPLIRVQDMDLGSVKIPDLRSVSKWVDDEYRRSRVCGGDLLISIVGTIGRLAIVPNGFEGNIARAIARVACKNGVQTQWVQIWMSTQPIQWWLVSSSKEVARKTLNLSELGTLPLAIPSPAEQTEIVRRVESLFAFADQIEARVQEATARVKLLTQSILAKAFRGELTEEWRKAHPELVTGSNSAEALLERIRAARAAAPETKGKRGRKTLSEFDASLLMAAEPVARMKRGRPRKG